MNCFVYLRLISDDTNLSINVKCKIVSRKLELYDCNNMQVQINKLSFDDTYYNSVCSRKLVLFNNSPIKSHFMAIVHDKFSECADMSEGLAVACSRYEHDELKKQSFQWEFIFGVVPKMVQIY